MDEEAAACQHIAEDLLTDVRPPELVRSTFEIASTIEETVRRLHAGSISAAAREGGGTVFDVTLPLRTP